jgi:hypothetical protein
MKKISDIFWIVFAIAVTAWLIYDIGKRFFTDHINKNNMRYTKAVIINIKNWDPNDRVNADYHYSYRFVVDGKTYQNDSNDTSLKVGDSVKIEYDKNHPALNKLAHDSL